MRITLLVLLACIASALQAQTFPVPGKPVRIVVPFPPGGQTDIQARAIAQKMNQSLNVPVIVDNKPGGSSIIGAREVQRAAPDGHGTIPTAALGRLNRGDGTIEAVAARSTQVDVPNWTIRLGAAIPLTGNLPIQL